MNIHQADRMLLPIFYYIKIIIIKMVQNVSKTSFQIVANSVNKETNTKEEGLTPVGQQLCQPIVGCTHYYYNNGIASAWEECNYLAKY